MERFWFLRSSTATFERRIRFWRVSDGMLLETLDPGSSAVLDAELSPDGTAVAYGSSDGTVTLARNPLLPQHNCPGSGPADRDGDQDVDRDDLMMLVQGWLTVPSGEGTMADFRDFACLAGVLARTCIAIKIRDSLSRQSNLDGS